MAATNKSLAQSNKSPTGSNATNSHRQRAANFLLGVCVLGKTRCGSAAAGLSSLFTGPSLAEVEH